MGPQVGELLYRSMLARIVQEHRLYRETCRWYAEELGNTRAKAAMAGDWRWVR